MEDKKKDELKNLYIYLAEDCNLKCQHCWVEAGPYSTKRHHLNFADSKNFLLDTINLGLKSVILSGGEPFLNKDILAFINFFHENNISVAIETNGTLINDEPIIEVLKNCRPFLAISIDGITKKTHEKQRGRNSFDKVLKAINIMEKIELPYQLIMAVSKYNNSEIEKLFEYVSINYKFCNSIKLNPVNETGRAEYMAKSNLLYSFEDLFELTKRIQILKAKYSFKIMIHLNKPFLEFSQIQEGFACGGYCGIKTSMSILPDSTISVCSLGRFSEEKFNFGKCYEVDVEKLWSENPLLVDLRSDDYVNKLKGVCNNCIFKMNCRGSCRAQSVIEYSDIYAPSPKCQALFDAGLFPKKYLINN